MRTRLLRPELLTDEMLGGLPDGLVLFYVKLWLLTDDDGYFEFRPGQIAATLYPYRSAGLRMRQVDGWLTRLADLDRVTLLECGLHAVIPTIVRHRIKGGNMTFQYRLAHEQEGESPPVRTGTDGPDSGQVQTGTDESLSDSVRESLRESESGSAAVARSRTRGGGMSKVGDLLAPIALPTAAAAAGRDRR